MHGKKIHSCHNCLQKFFFLIGVQLKNYFKGGLYNGSSFRLSKQCVVKLIKQKRIKMKLSIYLLLLLPFLTNGQTTKMSDDEMTTITIPTSDTTIPSSNIDIDVKEDGGNPCKSNPCGNGICKLDNENRFGYVLFYLHNYEFRH